MNEIQELRKGALLNKDFRNALWEADGDLISISDSPDRQKVWVPMYYGWLIAKYGADWRNQI